MTEVVPEVRHNNTEGEYVILLYKEVPYIPSMIWPYPLPLTDLPFH